MRILVVEDERRIAADVARSLDAAGFVAEVAHDGEDGWFRGDSEPFDAAVLDLGLPRLDGVSVLKRWRAAGRPLPVLILTARDGWREKVDAIDAGADDYLTKPFRMEELVARVRAITRRAAGRTSPLIAIGPVELDTRHRSLSVEGRAVALTALEYRLLAYLMTHAGRVVSQHELSEHIYSDSVEHESNAVEVLVARLRKKLGVPLLETRRGHGYVIERRDGPA
ncbi:response regulator transcription factor [Salinarimonas soli]|uniref:Response regulator transcription factor n=1 Tax=Salinarimonas soli TaxID=1638099 RepID=A0A5B2VG06_9HYPH|nr:response regulator transcription factor [Salinarimonas soli]KAA2237526.1 response regulator transcription factor [Salinarimonas soli]